MFYRPSKWFVVCLVGLTGTGGGAAWAWSRAAKAPSSVRVQQGFWAAVTYKPKRQIAFPTAEDRVRMRAQTEEMVAKLEAEFPALAVKRRSVPEERNGFRQFFQFQPQRPGFETQLCGHLHHPRQVGALE